MNIAQNTFCYDLGIPLTGNNYCHEVSCPYATKCLPMELLLSFDTLQDITLNFSSSIKIVISDD